MVSSNIKPYLTTDNLLLIADGEAVGMVSDFVMKASVGDLLIRCEYEQDGIAHIGTIYEITKKADGVVQIEMRNVHRELIKDLEPVPI